MKRLIAWILLVSFVLMPSALAREGQPKAEISVDGVYRTTVYHGEESLTHGWIVAEVTLTNYALHPISVERDLSATLVYDGLYTFEAEAVFAVDVFEPLVSLQGEMVFRVPHLVLQADCISVTLTLDGETQQLDLAVAGGRASGAVKGGMDTPEEAIAYFISCLREADFEQLTEAFGCREKMQHLDFDWYIRCYRMLQFPNSVLFPENAAYTALNAANTLPTSMINMLVCSLLCRVDGTSAGSCLIRYKDGMLQGEALFENEAVSLQEYRQRMDPARLQGLTLEKIYRLPVDPEGRQRISQMKTSLIYGYTDYQEYIACVSFEGEAYVLPVVLCRYADGWRVDRLMNTQINGSNGMFIRAEDADADFSQWILTYENGACRTENLLAEAAYDRRDMIGAWKNAGGTLIFDEKFVTAPGYEETYRWAVSGEHLYLFENEGSGSLVVRFTLTEDALTLHGESVDERLAKEQ